jgi:hypothetical protein
LYEFDITNVFLTLIVCAVRKVAPNQTFLYFWTFNVFVGFLLLNMVLAVIFAVYEQVNDAAFAASEKNSNLKTE